MNNNPSVDLAKRVIEFVAARKAVPQGVILNEVSADAPAVAESVRVLREKQVLVRDERCYLSVNPFAIT